MLAAFEAAEREQDADKIRRLLTFVIVGGGPTGVEMAGAVAETARHTLRGEFRRIDPSSARVFLIEGGDRVLTAFGPKLSERAKAQLEQLGVIVRPGCLVTDVREQGVTVKCGQQTEEIDSTTLVWAAGVRASSLGKALAEAAGTETDRQGRVAVGADLTLPGHPEVFVIGDLANVREKPDGPSLPGPRAGGDAARPLCGEAHPPPA